jgi:hypothetical protein
LKNLLIFNKLGFAYTGDSVKQFAAKAIELIDDDATLGERQEEGNLFFLNTYSVEKATKQITRILN